jgi:23S rRNA G2445 N2-methylase RlmL
MAAGFEPIVRRALEADVAAAEIVEVDSGSIVLRADTGAGALSTLASLPYLSLVLVEIGRYGHPSLDRAVANLVRRVSGAVPEPLARARSFRVRVSDAGKLTAIDPRARRQLEDAIGSWSGARADPRGGGAEVWLLRRRGQRDVGLFVRLDRPSGERPAKGALKPDLAAALVRTVAARAGDVVLDPYAGSGAIVRARASLPHRRIVATDVDETHVAGLRRLHRQGRLGPHATVGRLDARDVHALEALLGGVDVDTVVTDPPWGLYEAPAGGSLADLYLATYATFRAVMAPAAPAVVLTGVPETAITAARTHGFAIAESLPVLVNGRKASVVVATAR